MTYEQINKIALKIVDTGVVCLIVCGIYAIFGIWGILVIALLSGFFILLAWSIILGLKQKYGDFDRAFNKEEQLPPSQKLLP